MFKTGPQYREKVSQMITWGHWFALFNILASLAIGSRYFLAADWPPTLFGRVYAFVSWIGHFGFLGFAAYLLILFPLTFVVMSQRILRLVAVILATSGLTLLLVDTEVFSQFHLHLSPVVWEILVNPDDGELSRNWQLLFVAVPLIFLIELLFANWSWNKLRSLSRRTFDRYFAVLFITCFITAHLVYSWADATLYRPITMQKANLPLYYPMTAKRFLERYGFLDQAEYAQQRSQFGSPDASTVHYPREDVNYQIPAGAPRYNVLMIVVNGLRADALNPQEMPALNQFADGAQRFTNNFSNGNNANSGLFGLFYGITPTYLDGILSIQKSSEMIDLLQKQNYQMGLFSANGFAAPLYRRSLFNGFYLPKNHPKNLVKSDAAVTQRWQQWVTQPDRKEPWFAYVNYSVPAAFDKAISQRSRGLENSNEDAIQATSATELEAKYAKAVTSVDEQLQKVFTTLQQDNLLQNTIVIITSDHGMEFNESGHNRWGYNQSFSPYELRVPLVIHWPGKPAATVQKLTSNLDVSTTLMQDLLHVTNPTSDYSQGENLFTPERKNNWILAGDANQLVIISPDQQMQLDNRGQFNAYDNNYKPLPEDKPRLAVLLQALKEVRRFITD